MIQEALKVIAQFKDEASAGLKKLQGNLSDVGKQAGVLKPLGDKAAADNIARLDREASRAARGGLRQLATVAGSLKENFSGAILAGGDAATIIATGVTGAANAATAAFAGLSAGILATSTAFQKVQESSGLSAENLRKGLEVLRSAQGAGTDRASVNAGRRAATGFFRSQGFSSAEAKAAELAVSKLNTALEVTKTKVGALSALSRNLFADPNSLGGLIRGEASNALGLTALVRGFGLVTAGVVAAVAAFEGLSAGIRSAADNTAELAQKLGLTRRELAALQLLAEENGTTVESLTRTFDRLDRVLAGTDQESDKAAKSLKTLGISLADLEKLDAAEAASKILAQYDKLGPSAERTAAVQNLLGQNFRENSVAIRAAATDLEEARKRVTEYGAVASDQLVAAGGEQEKAINNLGLAFKGLGIQIAENTVNLTAEVAQFFADVIKALKDTNIIGTTVRILFRSIKLVIFDSVRALSGFAAALVALASGEFRQAAAIAGEVTADFKKALEGFSEQERTFRDEQEKTNKKSRERTTIISEEAKARKKLFDEAVADLTRRIALAEDESEITQLQYDLDKGRYAFLSAAQKAELVDLTQILLQKQGIVAADQKRKQLEEDLNKRAGEISVAEEELKFASLTTQQREEQTILLRELNRLRVEGKDLSDVEKQNLEDQVKVIAKRQAALTQAQADARVISELVDNSEVAIRENVTRNIQLAAGLLEARKISESDYVRFVEQQLKRITDLNKQAAEESSEFWREAARGIQQALATTFFDFMQGRLTDLVGSFKRVIDQLVAQALAARLGQALFGAGFEKGGQLGGFVGQGFNFLSGLFGGARASGGPIEPGKAYLVGEKGPELRTFSRAGSIVSNADLAGMGGSTTINFRVDAIDAASFFSRIDDAKRELAMAVVAARRQYNIN